MGWDEEMRGEDRTGMGKIGSRIVVDVSFDTVRVWGLDRHREIFGICLIEEIYLDWEFF